MTDEAATVSQPETETIKGTGAGKPDIDPDIAHILQDETEYALTRHGDAERFLQRYTSKILIQTYEDNRGIIQYRPLWLTDIGTWSNARAYIAAKVVHVARNTAKRVIDQVDNAKEARAIVPKLLTVGNGFADRAVDEIYKVALRWREQERNDRGVTFADISEMDQHGSLLPCSNGVVDLGTCDIVPPFAVKKRLLSDRPNKTRYIKGATHPAVDALFSHLDQELAEYVKAVLGRALWKWPEKAFIILCGPRDGGKSTLTNAIQAALGDEAGAISQDAMTLGGKGKMGPTPERVPLVTCRIVTAVEVERWRIDSAKLKAYAGGGDYIPVQRKFQAERSEKIIATIILSCNNLPRLDLSDAAVADRARIVPYPKVPDPQPWVKEQIDNDPKAAEAMLALLVHYANKYPPGAEIPLPKSVLDEIQAAKDAEGGDLLAWIKDNLVAGDKHERLGTKDTWKRFLSDHNTDPESSNFGKLTQGILSREIGRHFELAAPRPMRIDGVTARGWFGVRFKTSDEKRGEDPVDIDELAYCKHTLTGGMGACSNFADPDSDYCGFHGPLYDGSMNNAAQ